MHKAGLHAAAVVKEEWTYQHVDPARVGNTDRFLISELAGIGNVVRKLHERGIEVSLDQARSIRDRVKEKEALGWQYEGAEASFEMLVRRMLGDYKPPFEITSHKVTIEPGRRIDPRTGEREYIAGVRMTVMVRKNDREWKGHADHEGVGPVDALDKALRASIVGQYPGIASLRLTDFKVHIIDSHHSTEAMTRVLIESAAGEFSWGPSAHRRTSSKRALWRWSTVTNTGSFSSRNNGGQRHDDGLRLRHGRPYGLASPPARAYNCRRPVPVGKEATMTTALEVHGICDARFAPVRDVLERELHPVR